jgi:hypothetical protein
VIMRVILVLGVLTIAAPAGAQSPNTASLVVDVLDQTGGVVPGADVAVVNSDAGATRAATSGPDGTATVAALPINGAYVVTVGKQGSRRPFAVGMACTTERKRRRPE